MAQTAQQLQRNIMRRVYYVYALRMAGHPVTIHSALMALCVVLLTHFVSFPIIFATLLDKKLGELHIFLFKSAMSTEVWTLVLIALFLVLVGSLYIQLRAHRLRVPVPVYSHT